MKTAAIRAWISIAPALAVSTGSLLAPQSASALTFDFSFDRVSGRIENLVEGQNSCDGTTSCVVKVRNDGGTLAPTGTYLQSGGSGFTVSAGGSGFTVATAEWAGVNFQGMAGGIAYLSFGSGIGDLTLTEGPDGGGCGRRRCQSRKGEVSFDLASVQPPEASSVPGPLPLFGAATAFGFSRKLRKRIKVANTIEPTPPAG